MPAITLTTDFGLKDGYAGILRGVIWSICPSAQIADITHGISPQNVLEGAFILGRAYSFFPAGTIHLAVVDPGVGTQRRPIAVHTGGHLFVGPDNGLFTRIYEQAEQSSMPLEIVHLSNPEYWLPRVSSTFHGRDIFAPVAAHLAVGIPLEKFGSVVTDPVRLQLSKPERTATGFLAHITAVDGFGNLITDLPASALLDVGQVTFRLHGREVGGISKAYGNHRAGKLIVLVDSEGVLEIAVVKGNATQELQAEVGEPVQVIVRGSV
jgi:hypothetical protein